MYELRRRQQESIGAIRNSGVAVRGKNERQTDPDVS